MNALITENRPTRFCWLDLAAVDAQRAADFYAGLFGWQTQRQRANGGEYLLFTADGENLASLYQLGSKEVAAGVPSHWTPYVGVTDIEAAAKRSLALGGRVVVEPFAVDGTARVSLVSDAAGALLGLWEVPA